jgi:hypothetical protein
MNGGPKTGPFEMVLCMLEFLFSIGHVGLATKFV